MLKEVISEYLDRFAGSFTESLYNAKGYEDYNYMRQCCDYLDCDKNALTTNRTLPAGLRNIGNTCYLNTILQLLFHINYLREKISTSENLPSKLLKKLQFLFGILSVGKMPFADPTEVFEELRAGNPDVFAPGVQNDFHEVFTLLLETIEDGYRKTSPQDARYIRKLLLGKMVTKIDYGEGKANNNAEFNIINLDSEAGSFGEALQKWKKYKINDFTSPNGKVVTAYAENVFLQTPALMVFFINRVSFRDGKLEKNCKPFLFEYEILIAKAYQRQKTIATKTVAIEKEKEISEEKINLTNWLRKVETTKKDLLSTIEYLKSKQAPLLSEPIVQNALGEQSRIDTLKYLKEEVLALDQRSEAVRIEIKQLEEKQRKVWEQQNCQRYAIWGAMIHEGTSATYGHYKLCLLLADQWYEFNDKLVSLISRDVVDGYRDRGQICCLFYRRPLLACNAKKIAIPFPLKNSVGMFQRQFKRDIDKARILQQLYQQTQSISILMEYELKSSSQQRFQFFFKPVHYAFAQKYSHELCKGIMLQEQINSQLFLNGLKQKLIDQTEDDRIPFKSFGIPSQYFEIKSALCSFLDKQHTFIQLGEAYQIFSKANLKIECDKGRAVLEQICEIIILKGLYYLKVLSEYACQDYKSLVMKLSSGLDRMLSAKKECEFLFVCISIKASIPMFKSTRKLQMVPQNLHSIQDYGGYFAQHFKFWIKQRQQIGSIDETNYMAGAPMLTKIKGAQ